MLVVPNRAPIVEAFTAETTANEAVTVDLGDTAVDPDGDTLFFTCCDNQRGGAATTADSGPGR